MPTLDYKAQEINSLHSVLSRSLEDGIAVDPSRALQLVNLIILNFKDIKFIEERKNLRSFLRFWMGYLSSYNIDLPEVNIDSPEHTPSELFSYTQSNSRGISRQSEREVSNSTNLIQQPKLDDVTHSLSIASNFDQALQVLVQSAQSLVGGHSSTIVIQGDRTNNLTIGASTSLAEAFPIASRLQGPLTRKIIQTGEPVILHSIGEHPDFSQGFSLEGVHSLLGTLLQISSERLGVLYVYGQVEGQFTQSDIELLQKLAGQASVALGWTRLLPKPLDKIELAISQLSHWEGILENICCDIHSSLGFDFATIQLIRPEENIIETVSSIGVATGWAGYARNYLETDSVLRDIQADVAQARPLRIELITGWDDRFDPWIYEEFHHANLVRVFAPIVIVLNEKGRVADQWFEQCQYNIQDEEITESGRKRVIEMLFPELDGEDGSTIEVIGTVEAGYTKSDLVISSEQAIKLAKLISHRALEIRKTLLPYILETIVEHAMEIVWADAASLHFMYDPTQNTYVYEVSSGAISRRFLKENPPRPNGLGQKALTQMRPQLIPDPSQGHTESELEIFNGVIFNEGVRSKIAVPLLVDQKQGVLYVHFKRNHWFAEDEIALLQLFTNRAIDAIRSATAYTQIRDKAYHLKTLNNVMRHLVDTLPSTRNDLLSNISWNTRSLLSADIVTIYEYIESETRLVTPPEIAGRLLVSLEMNHEVEEYSAPSRLVRNGKNVYATVSRSSQTFDSRKNSSFVIREKIRSTAGILLKLGTEIVGVMFINYRRPHIFSKEEKDIIDVLASSLAIAIRNQRLLEIFNVVDRGIISTLDLHELLNLIIERAVLITGADLGDIRLIDPSTEELVTKARYPADSPIDPTLSRLQIGAGITGTVASNGKSIRLNSVNDDPSYKSYFEEMNSELCVPLLDKNNTVIGVLNVESRRENAFSVRDERILESLANPAVIAIQNAEKQKRQLSMVTADTLRELTSLLVQEMNVNLGAIRAQSQDIIDADEGGYNRQSIIELNTATERALQLSQRLQRWFLDGPSPINLPLAVSEVLTDFDIPHNISVHIDLPDDLPLVASGEKELKVIVSNLIQNAMDVMEEGGSLYIIGTRSKPTAKPWIILRVRDTGPGISEEDRERIFERGYSTKSDAKKELGEGLWWSRTYLERLGGQLTVNSWPHLGTEFIISLPAYTWE